MDKLNHSNVMNLENFHEDSDNIYLVMDLMVDDIYNVVKTYGALEETFARKIFKKMVESVNHC